MFPISNIQQNIREMKQQHGGSIENAETIRVLFSIFVAFPRFVEAAQTAGGIFCQDKPKEELNITFVDADGNLFECRVLFPKEAHKGR